MEETKNIVKNNSKAYGYNYASLSDIAEQGFVIPKMKTGTENEREYVYVYDTELKEWLRMAEVVIPQTKGQNEAQQYGSALTYARRYSTLMYLSLCCDDDKAVETNEPQKASSNQVEHIKKLYDALNIGKILKYYQVETLDDLTKEQASQIIAKKNEKHNNQSNG